MTEQQGQRNGSKVFVIIISVLWLLFLAGILGYTPYMKQKVPTQLEEKTEKLKQIYDNKPADVMPDAGK